MHKLDWSDLQYILAVAQQGSLAGAARFLSVNHSTVLRRINAFEQSQGVRLFERQRTGYRLTGEGQQLLEAAQDVEGVVNSLERKIAGKDLRLAGAIRLTTTDSFLFRLLGPHLAEFQKAYPDIVLNVRVTNHVLSLTRRDADVAIRPGRTIPAPLVGARICDLNFALYASPAYWRDHKNMDTKALSWLGLDDALSDAPPGRWLRANIADERIVFTADTFLAVQQAAEHGLGITVLPCFLGDQSQGLVRASDILEPCQNGLLILTHKDLMQTARIKTFTEFMRAALASETSRLLGSQ
ncbi:MAG: LysR family transcriptional regulator [Rhizobiales bacterium]|nr:LysR family transcriptional regulator [Hyphomicrobiales bacterium]